MRSRLPSALCRAVRAFPLILALLGSGCAARPLRVLPFLYDPYFAAIHGDRFEPLRKVARKAGYALSPVAVSDAVLSSGFYAALDRTPPGPVAVTPLFAREVLSAFGKYPGRSFIIAGEVTGFSGAAGVSVPLVSRDAALAAAGAFCGRTLSGQSAPAKNGRPPLLLMLVPAEGTGGEAPFMAGFTTVLSADRVLRVAVPRADIEGAVLGGLPGVPPEAGTAVLAAVIMESASPLWAKALTDRGVPVVAEGAPAANPLVFGTITVDAGSVFASAFDGLRHPGAVRTPADAVFGVTEAGRRGLASGKETSGPAPQN